MPGLVTVGCHPYATFDFEGQMIGRPGVIETPLSNWVKAVLCGWLAYASRPQ